MKKDSGQAGNEYPRKPRRLKRFSFFSGWSRLDAYIFSEIHFPFTMAMLVTNGIFFIRTFGSVSELSGGQFEVPLKIYFMVFLSEIPEILYLTTSLSFLLGSLAALGRMSADSEIVTPQSIGISFWRLSRPVLTYGFILSALLFLLTNWGGPRLNQLWQKTYREFVETEAIPNIDPGVITPMGSNSVLYVDEIKGGKLAGLFYINQSEEKEELLLAEKASIYTNRNLELFDAIIINLKADGSEVFKAKKWERAIPIPQDLDSDFIKNNPRDLLNTPLLYRFLRQRQDPSPRLWNEFYERLILPWICLIFAFFVVPLAARHTRGKSGSGFWHSIMIMAAYFFFARLCKDASVSGKMPPLLGMGMPPALFLLCGIFMQVAKHRWWNRFSGRLSLGFGWRKLDVRGSITRGFRLPKRGLLIRRFSDRPRTFIFPSKLDVYTVKSFFSIYLLVQACLFLLLALVEYAGVSKWVIRNNVDPWLVVRYMLYKAPDMLDISLFICLLIATLILFAVMSKQQEVTVVRAGGGSLQRLCLPLVLCGALISGLYYYMENSFLPHTNRVAQTLKYRIKQRQNVTFSRDVWLKAEQGEIINYRFFDNRENRLVGVRCYRLGGDPSTLLEHTDLPVLRFDGDWILEKPGLTWRFYLDEEGAPMAKPTPIAVGTPVHLNLNLEDLVRKKRKSSEFSIRELKDYLQYLKNLGYSEQHFHTALYAKYAQPLMPFIMMLLAMPLGFQFGRKGSLYGVATGLVAGLSFWGLFELFKKLGSTGVIHPMAAGWSVVLLFGFVALYRYIYLE